VKRAIWPLMRRRGDQCLTQPTLIGRAALAPALMLA